jgi:hypothetical protein
MRDLSAASSLRHTSSWGNAITGGTFQKITEDCGILESRKQRASNLMGVETDREGLIDLTHRSSDGTLMEPRGSCLVSAVCGAEVLQVLFHKI